MAAKPVPEALLRETFELMHARHSQWPDSFEAVMADPQRSRLVRINAALRRRAVQARPSYVPSSPVGVRATQSAPLTPPPTFDRKRAAAGDREDD